MEIAMKKFSFAKFIGMATFICPKSVILQLQQLRLQLSQDVSANYTG